MPWYLFRKDTFSYVIFEYNRGELARKMSFHDDRGLRAAQLIKEAKEMPDRDRSTVQQFLAECEAVKY
jgi:hypothetical protein